MGKDKVFFNGINAETGEYISTFSLEELASIAKGSKLDKESDLDVINRAVLARKHLGLAEGIELSDLSQTGWGVIFAENADPEIKEALKPLLDLRRKQAGKHYFEFGGKKGYKKGEDKKTFLRNRGAEESGPADPEKGMPYYLLIVGDPQDIPYGFQHLLDVTYSIGRLHFDGDNAIECYANYANNVVAAEKGYVKLGQRAVFFAPSNADDGATTLSSTRLVQPLTEALKKKFPTWQQQIILDENAKKETLAQILNGKDAPALLFTASHGMAFSKGSSKQIPHQGALLCADWPGPEEWQKAIPERFYFHAEDLQAEANLRGMIAFHFACYGGGTPEMDSFAKQAFTTPKPIANKAFVAALPQKMLGHTRGALAVICHIERAWGYSFLGSKDQQQIGVFNNTVRRLFNGRPVGAAVEFFNDKYAELATELSDKIEESEDLNTTLNKHELANLWTSQNDARGYAVIGDPAVRLHAFEELKNNIRPDVVEIISRPVGQPSNLKEEKTEMNEVTFGKENSENFGLLDSFNDTREQTAATLKKLSGKLNAYLENVVDDMTSLEVATFVSEDLNTVTHDRNRFTGNAKLRALTRINLDGDMQVCVPEKNGEIDETLWRIHCDTVAEAQKQRTETLKALGSIVGELLSALKFLPL